MICVIVWELKQLIADDERICTFHIRCEWRVTVSSWTIVTSGIILKV